MIDNRSVSEEKHYQECLRLHQIIQNALQRHQRKVIPAIDSVITVTGERKGVVLHRGFAEQEVCSCGRRWPCPDYMILSNV